MRNTWELMQAAVPTRQEKRRVARCLGLKSESLLYAYCEDPERSGRPNPFDKALVVLDHAILHQPDAALEIAQLFHDRVNMSIATRGKEARVADLVLRLQPDAERESMDAITAFSRAVRQQALGGACDAAALLREVDEARRQLKMASITIRAALEAERAAEA